MSPDAKLRMDVYQEGQRAFSSGKPCPYTDWRAKTWAKGRTAAAEWHADVLAEDRRDPAPAPSASGLTDVQIDAAARAAQQAYNDCRHWPAVAKAAIEAAHGIASPAPSAPATPKD